MGAPTTVTEAGSARVAEGGPLGAPATPGPLDHREVMERYCLRTESGQDPVDHLAEFLRAHGATEDVVCTLLYFAVDEINARRACASSG